MRRFLFKGVPGEEIILDIDGTFLIDIPAHSLGHLPGPFIVIAVLGRALTLQDDEEGGDHGRSPDGNHDLVEPRERLGQLAFR